jgi:hypothetical protein
LRTGAAAVICGQTTTRFTEERWWPGFPLDIAMASRGTTYKNEAQAFGNYQQSGYSTVGK